MTCHTDAHLFGWTWLAAAAAALMRGRCWQEDFCTGSLDSHTSGKAWCLCSLGHYYPHSTGQRKSHRLHCTVEIGVWVTGSPGTKRGLIYLIVDQFPTSPRVLLHREVISQVGECCSPSHPGHPHCHRTPETASPT